MVSTGILPSMQTNGAELKYFSYPDTYRRKQTVQIHLLTVECWSCLKGKRCLGSDELAV